MPGLPFTTPVTDEELWANILHDWGAQSYSSQQNITMHDILLHAGYGVYQDNLGTFGDGSDGVCTFIATGSTTVAGATLSSGTYTATRDIWLASGSTINSTVILNMAGFRLFCQGELINNGTIASNGNAASANTAGAALAYTGTISNTTVGTAGGAGTTSTTGTAGTNTTASLGGVGGTGGLEGGGSGTGGAGGTVTAPAATQQLPRSLPMAILGRVGNTAGTGTNVMTGGSGGGAGAGDGTNLSGGGGGGGGIVVVSAQRIAGTGTISANGGAGGAASGTGNSGGGGGGGGGLVIVVARNVQPVAVNSSGPLIPNQTITASGGAGGAGTGTGAAGNSVTAAAAGTVILLPA